MCAPNFTRYLYNNKGNQLNKLKLYGEVLLYVYHIDYYKIILETISHRKLNNSVEVRVGKCPGILANHYVTCSSVPFSPLLILYDLYLSLTVPCCNRCEMAVLKMQVSWENTVLRPRA